MRKKDVIQKYGSHEKTSDRITELRGKKYARTAVTMWGDIIPVRVALFLDMHGEMKFDKTLYQDKNVDMLK